MPSVLGIGNALVDIIIRLEDENFLRKMNLPRGSMTMIDSEKANTILRESGENKKDITQGGAVANTITGLANLGVSTGYMGKIGNDEFGNIFRKDLEEKKINPHLMYGDSPTGRALTLLSQDGERTFGTFLGAAVEMKADEIIPVIFRDYQWLVAEGYLIFNRQLITAALELAKQQGMQTAMDMASYNLVESNLEFIKSLVKDYVDLVFANEMEARALTGFGDPREAAIKIGEICPTAVVKVGRDGSWIFHNNEVFRVQGIEARCIDTTGAGDLYAAGFIFGLISGFSLEKCGKIGSVLGGHAVEVIGARLDNDRWIKIRKQIERIED
jgi:sugar/nucleoside kinase (ribokinase family)